MEKKIEIQTDPRRLKSLSVGDTSFRSSNDHALSERDIQQAFLKLGETVCIRNSCLYKLKQMLSKDQRMMCRADDDYLLRFLRYKKFNVDAAYKALHTFYSTRKKYPELFSLSSELESLLNVGIFTYLPYRDEEGSIIFLNKYGKWNVRELQVRHLMQIILTISDITSMNPSCQINGITLIWDLKNTNSEHAFEAVHPTNLKLWLNLLQDVYPWRIKRVILLHCNRLWSSIFSMVRYFLKKKNADKVIILQSDMRKLHEYINPVILPKEYGGQLEEDECSITDHIIENLPYLKYERSFVME